MRKQFIIILLALLAIFGLMVSCKNEVPNAGFGEELVSISFREDLARGLTATLEGFDKDHLYWAYAAQKADGSHLISGQTDSYDESGAVWVKTDGYNKPVEGLGSTGTSGYEAYKVSGFSQGYWNFKLYAYKGVLGDNPATEAVETDYYVLVYQGEAKNALLKSDSVNAQGSHMVSVTVDPVQSEGNGTMVFLTDKEHAETARISMNTVNSATYGTNYTVKVLSILSMEDFPVEYVDAAGAKIHEATDSQDGEYTLPAGSYKVTVAFTDSASAPTVNYARGTIVATVYSNLTTTISGDLTEAMTYAEFDGILNPDLKTVTISSEAIEYDELHPTTQVSFSSTGTAKAVTATTTQAVTNQIIREIVATNGTNTTEYNQSLVLTLNVETVESTATTATYEIGMTAELTSSKSGDPDVVTTSDVSEVDEHVTIVIQLQPGLEDVNVLHDGHQMAKAPAEDAGYGVFSYDKASGELTIITKSFSPFTVSFALPSEDYVAQVGNLKYLTLSGAIDNASDNATVTLLKNVGETVDFNIYAGILDLAGYKITGNVTASKYGATVRNGSITGTLTATGNSALIKDLTVTGKISVGGTGTVLENCTVTGTGDYAVEVATDGNATIKSGTYKAADNQKILNGSILVEDGNFKGTLTESASVSLVGGVYEYDVKDYVADGYECAKVSEGVYKVRKIVEAVNVDTEVEYYFLQDAIDATSAGQKVKLLRNVNASKTITVGEDKNITLVMDGKSISSSVSTVILNNGTLTIDGTKEESAICTSAFGLLQNEGTAVLKGGSYTQTGVDGYAIVNHGTMTIGEVIEGVPANGIVLDSQDGGIESRNSGAELTINDGSFTAYNKHAGGAGTEKYRCVVYVRESEATINGGSFIYAGPNSAGDVIKVKSALVTINGGSLAAANTPIVSYQSYSKAIKADDASSRIVVNGGELTGSLGGSGLIEIHGGTHNVKFIQAGSNWSIDGGTFNYTPGEGASDRYVYDTLKVFVPEGFRIIENDNTWTVEEIQAVRIERGTEPFYYGTFDRAFAAVQSGDKMYILLDCTASDHGTHSYDFSGKNVTIHVNDGVTLACGDVTNGKFNIGWNNAAGTLTIEGPGKITLDSNGTWGLITQNGSGDNIKAVVKEVTIEASSANGYVMKGGNLTIESGYYKNIAFATGTKINGGYFTTDVSDCAIVEGKACHVNPYYPASSVYEYFISAAKPEDALFSLLHGSDYSYYTTLAGLDSAVSGDLVTFIGSDSTVNVDSGVNKFRVNDGVVYDLNGHTIEATPSAYAFYMGIGSKTITMKNGTINATNKLCEDNSKYTFTVIATDLTINDAIRESALSHISNGYFVKGGAGFFTITDVLPSEYSARIENSGAGRTDFYYTGEHGVSYALSEVVNGDYVYVYADDSSAKATLKSIGDSITITVSEDIDYPEVITSAGDIEETDVGKRIKKYTVVKAVLCHIGSTKYYSLRDAFTALTANATIVLDKDIILSSSDRIYIPAKTLSGNRNYTLDFNGHTITHTDDYSYDYLFNFQYGNSSYYGGTFTFKDSSVGKTGGIRITKAGVYGIMHKSRYMNTKIESGVFESSNDIIYYYVDTPYSSGGTFIITGGSFVGSSNDNGGIDFPTSSGAMIESKNKVSGGYFSEKFFEKYNCTGNKDELHTITYDEKTYYLFKK